MCNYSNDKIVLVGYNLPKVLWATVNNYNKVVPNILNNHSYESNIYSLAYHTLIECNII